MFVTFEGIEGSGKSTQIRRLSQWLHDHGRNVVVTHEPGGTILGQSIRQLLLNLDTHITDPNAELLLFFADRVDHIASVIQPALAENKVVLCDRYVDSTWAYQCGGREIPEAIVVSLNALISVMPAQTILFDIAPEEGLKRAKKRATLDRFEAEKFAFHHRVRDAYLARARQYPDRIHVIAVDDKPIDIIFEEVIERLSAALIAIK